MSDRRDGLSVRHYLPGDPRNRSRALQSESKDDEARSDKGARVESLLSLKFGCRVGMEKGEREPSPMFNAITSPGGGNVKL